MRKTLINLLFGLLFISLGTTISSEISESQKKLLESLPPDQRSSISEKMEKASELESDLEEVFEQQETLVERSRVRIQDDELCEECIFGYDIFKFAPTTFSPVDKIPVSSTYTLGPGDKLEISYYGNQKKKDEAYISRDGIINLPLLGPVNLTGLTFDDAKDLIKNKVTAELVGTKVSISLSELRSINVYILGEAYKPGSYTLSSLSKVTNALFAGGGVNKQGSLRNIQIRNKGKEVKTYDLYDLLINGDPSSDFRLEDGDTIFIPFIENTLSIKGAFKRPFLYEFLPDDTVKDAISFAGGFKSNVGSYPKLSLNSIDFENYRRNIKNLDYSEESLSIILKNGDTLTVSGIEKFTSETVELTGQFKFPGVYSLKQGDTLQDMINRAGGVTEQGYTHGAVFTRKNVAALQKEAFERTADELEKTLISIVSNGDVTGQVTEFTYVPITQLIKKLREIEPLGRQVVNVDELSLKSDPYTNFELRDGDVLHVPKRPYSVAVVGEVLNSTTHGFNAEWGVGDYIDSSGGLTDQADKEKIFVISPNGKTAIYKNRLFSSGEPLIPGSTVVVSRESRPLDGIKLTQIITPILAD
jgi:protein involved in polysaccharide export with SLBB domain